MASLKKKFGKISDNIDKSQERLLLSCKESDLLLINKINRISDSWFQCQISMSGKIIRNGTEWCLQFNRLTTEKRWTWRNKFLRHISLIPNYGNFHSRNRLREEYFKSSIWWKEIIKYGKWKNSFFFKGK